MQISTLLRGILAGGLILSVISCGELATVGEVDDIQYEATYAIPLIHSTSTIAEILKASGEDLSLISTDNNGTYTFEYEGPGPDFYVEEYVQDLPDFPFIIPEPSYEMAVNFFSGMTVEQVNLKAGNIVFEMYTGLRTDIEVTIRFPQFTKDGVPFSTTTTIEYQGQSPSTNQTAPIDLTDYQLTLNDGKILMEYTAMDAAGNTVVLDGLGGWARSWDFSLIKGLFDNDQVQLEADTMIIDLFEDEFVGEFSLTNPQLDIVIENSFGMEMKAEIASLVVVKENGEMAEVTGTIRNEGILLNAPNLNEIGQSKTTTISINGTNSNLPELFKNKPRKIIYSVLAIINPDNADQTAFVTGQSSLTSSVTAIVPAHGTFKIATTQSTTVDFGQPDGVTHAEFKLITTNGIPFGAKVQFYFKDQNNNVIDSLFDGSQFIMDAATVGSDGFPTIAGTHTEYINVDAKRMTLLQQSESMEMKAALATTSDGQIPVKITEQQSLGVQLGVKLTIQQ